MSLGIVELIAGVFRPAAELVDEMHTSEDERLAAKAKLLDIQASAMQTVFEYEAGTLKAQAEIVNSEAKSEHFLTSNWRPMVMLSLMACIMGYWFGYKPDNLTPEDINNMFALVQIGLGGYVVGRSGEKIAKTLRP